MHLVPGLDDGQWAGAPDVFMERVLQARQANFWWTHSSAKESWYDPIAAEDRHEKFCNEFLPTVPPPFALQPDKQWDKCLPTLPLQRQILYMAIFDSLCHNFRPVLFQEPNYIQSLPNYKQVLFSSHQKALAVAALNLLEVVSTLHVMMGNSYTRFASIIIPTFETAVLLLCLCLDSNLPTEETGDDRSNTINTDPLVAGMTSVTQDKCIQAAHCALGRLQNLAEVSNMAEVGARTLARLVDNIDKIAQLRQEDGDLTVAKDLAIQVSEARSCVVQTPESIVRDSLASYLSAGPAFDIFNLNSEEMGVEFGIERF